MCTCVCLPERDRQGVFGNTNGENRMRCEVLLYLPVERKTGREEEESRQRAGMRERMGKEGYGGARFVCISLEEMESYYRYTQCCQQLHSEFSKDVCVV